ncbi:PTS system mannose/fructose/sorbose family transporter subunit IID [Alkalibaculum sp. M08DMB]|uniref:PTS system mannose/fructose/sorbose family transporter subunit IID n=1 Tax=Alkalibaculum sporogenes TaxID=2655001 RepID=A0A6A7K8C1_9FIRM|nr:PTS system mannose/fructose/sorbose family transporter subunit IID [Alkalibaculum sporogenes]MPW25625.1 PTS system mannose/fructose/sorbose family transporter subunit IID [Alkalibaculum sporogenes]
MEDVKLDKKVVFKSWLIWLFFNQGCYNYERMQGVGFCHSMVPIIKKLYKEDKEEEKKALQRHLTFFNTEPNFGSPVVGLTVAMEEQRANGAEISDEAINSVKTGLMGPVSGIGDTVIQGVIVPLLLAFGIGLSIEGNLMGPILYIIIITATVLSISYFGFMQGYKKGKEAIMSFLSSGLINRVVAGAGIMGCMVLGALVANYVSLSTPAILSIGEQQVAVQAELFDVILPKVLPLGITIICFKLLDKGLSSIKVMLSIIAIGILGGTIGIF